MPVPTQDLKAHHAALLEELNAAARRVIASGRYIQGPEGESLEREVAAACGMAEAVGVSSGTDALLVVLMALGIGPGDEVVTTPFTFFATAGAIARLGAIPVFADVEPDTLNLDPEEAGRAIGPRTRAVLTVHLFGRMARTGELAELCARRGIVLLEDAAQSIGGHRGGDGARVGKLGLAATLSFFPAKNLGCLGDGGMVITDDGALAQKLRILRIHGSERRYHHKVVGGNFRLDEIQAAFLRVKLPRLGHWTELRRVAAARYRANLAGSPGGLVLPPEDPGCVWNQFVVRVSNAARDGLQRHLAGMGIGTAVYYPVPLHLQECFSSLGHKPGDFPVAEKACQEALALPLYPEISAGQIDEVCEGITDFFRR
jgi:dTDP-4-amino-4,6-dideoxygalactose transaminase